MTENRKDDREALDRLTAAMVDDLLQASDDELIAEILEEGRNPTEEAEAMRALIEQAARECGKVQLEIARALIASSRGSDPQKVVRLKVADARRKLASLLAQDSARGVLMAARAESELSDSDVFGMLADLEELGIRSEAEGSDS